MKKSIQFMSIVFALFLFNTQVSAQVMRVINNKVGISNNSPVYPLDVTGDIRGYWFRTTGARGLFSQTYSTYLTPTNGSYWSSRSDRGWYIRNKANVLKGYVYHNNANGFGLLDRDGTWVVRSERDVYTSFPINNVTRMKISANGLTELSGSADASKTANTGVFEIANTLRMDGNEIITNGGTLFLQHDNAGDLRIDNTTLFVDASANTISTPKIIDASNSAYYSDPSFISRLNYVYPRVTNAGFIGSNSNRWFRGYFTNMHRVTEHVLSDARMKENVKNIDSALDKVLSLNGKTYNYIKEVMEMSQSAEGQMQTSTAASDTEMNTMSDLASSIKKEEAYVDHKMAEGSMEAPEPITPETIVEDEIIRALEDAEISARDLEDSKSVSQQEYKKKNTFGFIAQEVNEVIPELVSYDEENDLYSMDYTAIIPLLVESIKIQQDQIKEQQRQIDSLKKMIEK